jgi:hypothetical protein
VFITSSVGSVMSLATLGEACTLIVTWRKVFPSTCSPAAEEVTGRKGSDWKTIVLCLNPVEMLPWSG